MPHNSQARRIPIAIVGTACRLPGAQNVDQFWEILARGHDAITEPSPARRETMSESAPTPSGFLEHIDGFDAQFFGFSPYEAVRLDPHHRLLLETVWEALEDAGYPPDRLAGSRTGVYTSCFGGDYWQLLREAGMVDMHAYLGAHRSSGPPGRIAHLLDLRGPSIEAESTCASSLIAVHLACQAIRTGEIGMAIVGGVNLLLCPEDRLGFAEAGIISPTSRCRFGDEDADGYVPAEGAVTVILKPLADALAAGDRIYATILGSGVSSNGRQALSASATGTTGQEDLLRTTLRSVGVAPADVDYVEAHGPGTTKGDAVELTTLCRVLGAGRDAGRPCLVGSVKSNIGHAEAAAGLAGLLKTALALKHRTVPATLHVRRPISVLDADDAPVALARTTQPWPDRGRPGIAGVTALGMFGIGAHVVLTEAPRSTHAPRPAGASRAMVLPLSAKDPAALATLAATYADTLANAPDPVDVCFSAGAGRTHLPYRLAVAGADRRSLVDRLRRVANRNRARPDHVAGDQRTRVVFVFSGQGSQWRGMARELLATEPVFARALHECAKLVRGERGWSLIDRLLDDEPLTVEHEIQPALWAIQVSLAKLWRHWGIEPDLVIGHSMGEVAAATTAGALSPRDGAAVICRRSALVGTLREPGAMVAVALGERDVTDAIGELADRVSVAVINSEHSTVLAGDPDALAAVVEPLQERGVYCKPIQANYASHSPNVEPLRETMVPALAELRPRPGSVPMYSTALDRVVAGDELDAGYWMANLREPVRFAAAVRAVLADRVPTLFVEISPHPLLVPALEDEIDACEADSVAVPSLRRHMSEGEVLRTALGRAYTRGCSPDWTRVYDGARFVPLPTYPWQRTRFWVRQASRPVAAAMPHPRTAAGEPAEAPRSAPGLRTSVTSAKALAEHIALRAAEVLEAAPGSVDPAVPLRVSGMDSVLVARLCRWLLRDLDLHVPIDCLLEDRALIEVAERLHDRSSRHEPAPTRGEHQPAALLTAAR
jgi:acyl transferase domain-containing protein